MYDINKWIISTVEMYFHCFVQSFQSILGTCQQTDFIMKNVLSAPFRASNFKTLFSFHGTFLFALELLNHYCSYFHFVFINKGSVFKVQIMDSYITSTTSHYIIVQLWCLAKQCLSEYMAVRIGNTGNPLQKLILYTL